LAHSKNTRTGIGTYAFSTPHRISSAGFEWFFNKGMKMEQWLPNPKIRFIAVFKESAKC